MEDLLKELKSIREEKDNLNKREDQVRFELRRLKKERLVASRDEMKNKYYRLRSNLTFDELHNFRYIYAFKILEFINDYSAKVLCVFKQEKSIIKFGVGVAEHPIFCFCTSRCNSTSEDPIIFSTYEEISKEEFETLFEEAKNNLKGV